MAMKILDYRHIWKFTIVSDESVLIGILRIIWSIVFMVQVETVTSVVQFFRSCIQRSPAGYVDVIFII